MAASDETALDCVKSVDEERIKLEKEADELVDGDMSPEVEQRLEDIYARYAPELLDLGGTLFRSVSIHPVLSDALP